MIEMQWVLLFIYLPIKMMLQSLSCAAYTPVPEIKTGGAFLMERLNSTNIPSVMSSIQRQDQLGEEAEVEIASCPRRVFLPGSSWGERFVQETGNCRCWECKYCVAECPVNIHTNRLQPM